MPIDNQNENRTFGELFTNQMRHLPEPEHYFSAIVDLEKTKGNKCVKAGVGFGRLTNIKMKSLIAIIISLIVSHSSFSQTVTFDNNKIYWDDIPLIIYGSIGKKSQYQHLNFVNNTANTVYIWVHTHSDLDFVRFLYDDGNSGSKIKVTLSPYGGYTMMSYVYLRRGNSKIYNDELGLDVSYNINNRSTGSAYFELDITAYLYKDHRTPSVIYNRPTGYHYIEVNGLPARWNKTDLPLTIYSNHTSFGFASNYNKVLQKAVNLWNAAGKSIGLKVDFFETANSSWGADIQMDWSGRNVPRGALGVAYPGRNIVGMLPLNYYSGLGQTGEVLCQELCHLLGVEHSDERYDIMNGTAHGHWHDLSEIEITERDRQMLGWLYSLSRFYKFSK